MQSNNFAFKKIVLAVSGIALAGMMSVSHAAVEGLKLLDSIGTYKGELKTYYATKPTSAELTERNKLAVTLARASGISLQQDKPLRLNETRTAFNSAADPSASFEVDSVTGNFLFNGGLLKYRKEVSTPNLPQDIDSARLASELLRKYGLTVDATQMKIAHIGGLNMSIADGASGKSEIFEKLKTVRFSRNIGGLPVEGDGRIVVHLGEAGALAGLVYQWPKLEKAVSLGSTALEKPATIRTRALREIEAKSGKALRAELTRADLVLYDDGKGVVEPAYHFVVKRYFDDGELEPVMIPYDFYVPATLKPQAFYPHMEVAAVAPKDGRAETTEPGTGNE